MIKLLVLASVLQALVPTPGQAQPDRAGRPMIAGVGPDPVKVRRAEADLKQLLLGKAIVREAEKHLGEPYVWGGKDENKDGGLDCSGFTSVVLKSFGIAIKASASEQYMDGIGIERPALGPGDLVFFMSTGSTPLHVGIYAGDGEFIHAPGTGKTVSRSKMNSSHFASRYIGARRYAPPSKQEPKPTPTRESKP